MSLEDRAAVEDEEFPVYGESYHRDLNAFMQKIVLPQAFVRMLPAFGSLY